MLPFPTSSCLGFEILLLASYRAAPNLATEIAERFAEALAIVKRAPFRRAPSTLAVSLVSLAPFAWRWHRPGRPASLLLRRGGPWPQRLRFVRPTLVPKINHHVGPQ
jgi:hypothetical protein